MGAAGLIWWKLTSKYWLVVGVEPLAACSVVVAPVVADGEVIGSVGVLGPTRMNYPRALATNRSTGLEVRGQERRHIVVCGTEGTMQVQPLDSPTVRLTLKHPRGEYRAGTQEIRMPPRTSVTWTTPPTWRR